MTARQLRSRVQHWQGVLRELGVGHWRIEGIEILDQTQGGPNCSASVFPSNSYDSVWFEFKRGYLEEADADRVDETIVHEWLHVAWRDMEDVKDSVCSWMPAATYSDFNERFTHETEGLIEAHARLIVRLHG